MTTKFTTFRVYNFINEIEKILHRQITRSQYPSILKCLELGYSAQTTASLI